MVLASLSRSVGFDFDLQIPAIRVLPVSPVAMRPEAPSA
jgi:hypothetical protein